MWRHDPGHGWRTRRAVARIVTEIALLDVITAPLTAVFVSHSQHRRARKRFQLSWLPRRILDRRGAIESSIAVLAKWMRDSQCDRHGAIVNRSKAPRTNG